MTTFYNELDPRAAAWLRELIAAGQIAEGTVDERSIADIEPSDLDGYERAHFFAGIGGWDLALRLAGWPDDAPVWTGSCPCQPFSCAGKQLGQRDERHLWPAWFRLIRERRPELVLGEQVASAIGHGWFDGVFADLEGEGYTCGATVLGAHSAGAPHIRQRLYWVAYLPRERRDRDATAASETGRGLTETGGATGGLGLPDSGGRTPWKPTTAPARYGGSVESDGCAGGLGDADEPRLQGRLERDGCPRERASRTPGAWSDHRIVPCADGKARRIGAGVQPLAHGIQGRVGLLRGYGNAIVPQAAAAFIGAVMEELGI